MTRFRLKFTNNLFIFFKFVIKQLLSDGHKLDKIRDSFLDAYNFYDNEK